MNKLFFICLFSFSFPILGMELHKIDPTKVISQEKLGNIEVFHDEKGFSLFCDGEKKEIHNYDIDPALRKLNAKSLGQFLKFGSLRISKFNNDEYSIKPFVQGPGGGPVAAYVGYVGFKAICYGTAALAAAGAVATVAPVGGAAAVLGVGGQYIGGTVCVHTLAASAGLGAMGITTAEAAVAVSTVTASAGGVAGVVAAVETGAVGFSAFLLALPIP